MPIVLGFLEISWVVKNLSRRQKSETVPKYLKYPFKVDPTIAIRLDHSTMTEDPHVQDKHLSLKTRKTPTYSNPLPSLILRGCQPLYSLSWGQLSDPCPGPRRSCSSHSLPLSIVCPCRSSIERPMSPGTARRHQSTQSDQKILGHLGAKILPQQYCLVQPSSQKILKRNQTDR